MYRLNNALAENCQHGLVSTDLWKRYDVFAGGHRRGRVPAAGVYDRHAYEDEKADALEKLAQLIDRIVSPPSTTNVVPLADRFVEGV